MGLSQQDLAQPQHAGLNFRLAIRIVILGGDQGYGAPRGAPGAGSGADDPGSSGALLAVTHRRDIGTAQRQHLVDPELMAQGLQQFGIADGRLLLDLQQGGSSRILAHQLAARLIHHLRRHLYLVGQLAGQHQIFQRQFASQLPLQLREAARRTNPRARRKNLPAPVASADRRASS